MDIIGQLIKARKDLIERSIPTWTLHPDGRLERVYPADIQRQIDDFDKWIREYQEEREP